MDFVQIDQELPAGASIQPDTVQTVIEGGRFIVHGGHTLPVAPEELAAKASIDVEQLLGKEQTLPTLN